MVDESGLQNFYQNSFSVNQPQDMLEEGENLEQYFASDWNGVQEPDNEYNYQVNNNNNSLVPNYNPNPELPRIEHDSFPNHQHLFEAPNDGLAAIYAGQFTPASSQELSYEDSESMRFPSQGSDFFCPASPTYSPSLPRMFSQSQSSQEESFNSFRLSPAPSPVLGEEDNRVASFISDRGAGLGSTEVNLFQWQSSTSQTDSQESTGSQPEAKRFRWGS